ncbi:MAG TPA: hypothetical protein VHL85_12335, partial [Burkholderiales bacterium]|nr:hypothetical protein [Burkholderiales bacterium]
PTHAGVYVLWAGDKVVCVGRADGGVDTVRSCLMQVLDSQSGESQNVTHYSWELCRHPAEREAELLRELLPHADNVTQLRRASGAHRRP